MYKNLTIKSQFGEYNVKFLLDVEALIKQYSNDKTVVTFVDQTVLSYFPKLAELNPISIFCDENTKTVDGSCVILKKLIKLKANTRTHILAIGGGVLQDVVGFCSSIFCRGIEYTLVPTTLLAQADSCIGGKTSINFENKKNILGTFFPPKEILIIPTFLTTLTQQDFNSGLGEIYKFYILQNKIKDFSPANNISQMIYDGLLFKKISIEMDEFDRAERKFLNFGHTFGHALESTSGYKIPHGIAVVVGCMIALTISKLYGFKVPDYEIAIEKGKELLGKSSIAFEPAWFDFKNLITATKADKKSTGNLTMVLINTVPVLENAEKLDIVETAIQQIYESI
jgi:3-dehydroquinate synthase